MLRGLAYLRVSVIFDLIDDLFEVVEWNFGELRSR